VHKWNCGATRHTLQGSSGGLVGYELILQRAGAWIAWIAWVQWGQNGFDVATRDLRNQLQLALPHFSSGVSIGVQMLAFRPVLSSVFALSSLISFSQSLNDKGKH